MKLSGILRYVQEDGKVCGGVVIEKRKTQMK